MAPKTPMVLMKGRTFPLRHGSITGAVLSDGHACCGFLSSWEVDQYSCLSVGHHLGCWLIGEYMYPRFLWISLSSQSQGEGLLNCVILCVSTRERRYCGMDLDVSYVRYPGLWRLWREERECGVRQSVVKLTGQLLVLMHITASFQSVLGDILQPGFHGTVWHVPELVWLHHSLGIPPLIEGLGSCEPLHFCDWCGPHDQKKCLVLVCLLVGCLLNVPATRECISGTDLLRQIYVLPH